MNALADVMVTTSMALEIARDDPDPRYREILGDCVRQSLAFYDPARKIFVEYTAPRDLPEGRRTGKPSSRSYRWTVRTPLLK